MRPQEQRHKKSRGCNMLAARSEGREVLQAMNLLSVCLRMLPEREAPLLQPLLPLRLCHAASHAKQDTRHIGVAMLLRRFRRRLGRGQRRPPAAAPLPCRRRRCCRFSALAAEEIWSARGKVCYRGCRASGAPRAADDADRSPSSAPSNRFKDTISR